MALRLFLQMGLGLGHRHVAVTGLEAEDIRSLSLHPSSRGLRLYWRPEDWGLQAGGRAGAQPGLSARANCLAAETTV